MTRVTTSDPSTAAIERAMVAIRRSQTRRSLNRIGARTGRAAIDPTVFGVLDAVQAHDGETTVTDIAAALGVDQPRASRLVGRAIGDGFLRREADQGDARRVLLRLTPAARTALGRAREVRQAAFARATADWPDGERTEFARLLTKFVADFDRVIAESAD